MICDSRLPEDGTPVPKHVGVGTYPELCFVLSFVFYYIVLSAFVIE
jgi:hypothetical protein